MRFVILTGMSGAGKSTALKMLEDMGYFCVDNLPIALIEKFVQLAGIQSGSQKVALGLDIRNGQALEELDMVLEELSCEQIEYEILFLDAEDSVLIKRYKETRRTHPLSGGARVDEGIFEERRRLKFLREQANYIIDTSHLLTRELRKELGSIFVDNKDYTSLFVHVLSFGFKYGIPGDADLVFDVRFLPNPYYVEDLKRKTGNDAEVQRYVLSEPDAEEFIRKLWDLIQFLIPRYIKEGKNQLIIGVGCTGGKHRSVTMANELYKKLGQIPGIGIKIEHRDIEKDTK
ncbi:MAG: RNase adapter RapZ [Eubacterium sp.]|nr:RNase adapter RapZ [Eubacterium sp.]